MANPIVIGLGEILFDIVGSSEELGGAPANFAYHAGRLGADAYIISTIGDDLRGKKAIDELEKRKLTTEAITVSPGHETGYVRADIDEEGIASYHFPDDIAWDNITLSNLAIELVQQADGICFGTLAQRSEVSRKAIAKCLDLAPEKAIKVYDINLRQNFYSKEIIQSSLKYADMLKLNDDELPVVADFFGLQGNPKEILNSLVRDFNLQLAVLTRGGEGSLLVSPAGASDHPGTPVEDLKDTIGAGDSFTASTLINLLKGKELDIINQEANQVAATVCGFRGAMPLL